ncbi:MAG: RNA polymerase ECF-type sigma factor [Candidatus Wolfebacteria bacterium GW2011_GWE1_48_7]|uniref:RNA polymerase ECF-type sigma factor n=2 Tax=Candidatus Wolfeibacteriota TaxID=1752735 RepID=A0A0G1U5K4_9BACT|nr:MAG: RNA polymerase ECF-type sigma factor, RNA polymerase sigma-70 factor, ECF subfamily [Candidatus Wolfebacteria bacterium GW2011_GWB1_47_1]KKU36621.1 MAG: RNA polymerase ECF-type sigma factor [Candidatus Wolfebacteria bacterium GW2011_GWC2_46_275]KKU41481.1 MAG: RNA polymerase ECF-type sigma factor [Candidatus Wolfebacteria bacterium GW2011_GWB2_46_69]KKU53579.1 MAG: RNA polymerase ECF-type sigma factor [Candidatus Wolfebacteria bacterium GW2011_GWC1_47_103]KKU58810.1 MAG: RNA polymerase 
MLDGEEKSIIERAIRGDSSAFGLLYDRYHGQIYRFVYLKVSHREEAEDITHHVFLNAWQTMAGYKDKGFPFSSLLYQIARNKVIDHYRTKKSSIDIEDLNETEIPRNEIALEDTIHSQFQMETIKNALKQMKQDYQDIIIMRYIEELTPSEVAKIMNKPEATVRVLQHRAIKQLRALLNK